MTRPTCSVLLVENDLDMRLLLRLMLRADPRLEIAGHAGSAEDALPLVDELDPDLILLDHGLDGDVLGLQAAALFKRRSPRAKVLLFSALDLRHEARAMHAIDCFLRKDRIRDLVSVMQRMLGLQAPEA